ncbi:MAG: ATP-dependent endonuclease [Terrestrivirus sp.]|uniref:ATP-dependent endonuclease n=1 Tax=Terrestrivirus sp. TaxID=2487775 RepID=A0A3G4ZNT7_9VIRU|nr:MAG: ATP-dependent endonuclease [Terrestrivirus sp.]
MLIKEVSINGFLSFGEVGKPFTVKFKNKNIIVGTNGTGKSNFIKLINMAIFDPDNLMYYINENIDVEPEIKITFELDDEAHQNFRNLYVFKLLHNFLNQMYQVNIYTNSTNINELYDQLNILNYGNNIVLIAKEKKGKINVSFHVYTNDNEEILLNDCNIHHVDIRYNDNTHDAYNYFKSISIWINSIFNNIDTLPIEIIKSKLFEYKYFLRENISNEIEESTTIQHIKNVIKEYNPNSLQHNEYYKNYIIEIFNNKINYDKQFYNFINEHTSSENRIGTKPDIIYENLLSIIFNISMETFIENYIGENICDSSHESIEGANFVKNVMETSKYYNLTLGQILNENEDEQTTYDEYKEHIFDLNDNIRIKHTLFQIKIHERRLYRIISEKFKKITDKFFDVLMYDQNSFDYRYVIVDYDNNDDYECSKGESELIDFLAEYYCNESQIIMIDEPCVHLSSQNKINFREYILNEDCNKQLIVITHDCELISEKNCDNIIYFKYENKKTKNTSLVKLDGDDKKLLFENKEVLFANKCLLVEGYSDYLFMKTYLSVFDINNYCIIITRGCGNKLWKILNKLEIDYNLMYDADKLFQRHNNPTKIDVTHTKDIIYEIIIDKIISSYENNDLELYNHILNVSYNEIKIEYHRFITEYIENNSMSFHNIFIWGDICINNIVKKSLYKINNDLGGDLEYILELLFGREITDKKEIYDISTFELKQCIEANKNNNIFQSLNNFLKFDHQKQFGKIVDENNKKIIKYRQQQQNANDESTDDDSVDGSDLFNMFDENDNIS